MSGFLNNFFVYFHLAVIGNTVVERRVLEFGIHFRIETHVFAMLYTVKVTSRLRKLPTSVLISLAGRTWV